MPESSIFAFSAASLIRCIAILSPERSMPSETLKLVDDPIHDALIKVVAAKAVIAGRSQNLLHAVAHLNDETSNVPPRGRRP